MQAFIFYKQPNQLKCVFKTKTIRLLLLLFLLQIKVGLHMDDTALQDLARQLGQEWPALGVNLGLKWAQIEHSKADHPMHTKSQIMDMLVTWRRGLGPDADPKQLLVRGLDAVDRTDLAMKIATNELLGKSIEIPPLKSSLYD